MKHSPPTVFEKEAQARKIKQLIADGRNNIELLKEAAEVTAINRRNEYCAYMQAGFAPTDALALVVASIRGRA